MVDQRVACFSLTRWQQHRRVVETRFLLEPACCVVPDGNVLGLAIGDKVRQRGAAAWDHRIRTGPLDKLGAMFKGFMEALDDPLPLERAPPYTRGDVLVAVRMAGPVAPIPMTPLPDEEAS